MKATPWFPRSTRVKGIRNKQTCAQVAPVEHWRRSWRIHADERCLVGCWYAVHTQDIVDNTSWARHSVAFQPPVVGHNPGNTPIGWDLHPRTHTSG